MPERSDKKLFLTDWPGRVASTEQVGARRSQPRRQEADDTKLPDPGGRAPPGQPGEERDGRQPESKHRIGLEQRFRGRMPEAFRIVNDIQEFTEDPQP